MVLDLFLLIKWSSEDPLQAMKLDIPISEKRKETNSTMYMGWPCKRLLRIGAHGTINSVCFQTILIYTDRKHSLGFRHIGSS